MKALVCLLLIAVLASASCPTDYFLVANDGAGGRITDGEYDFYELDLSSTGAGKLILEATYPSTTAVLMTTSCTEVCTAASGGECSTTKSASTYKIKVTAAGEGEQAYHFATRFIGVVEPATGKGTVISSGGPPPDGEEEVFVYEGNDSNEDNFLYSYTTDKDGNVVSIELSEAVKEKMLQSAQEEFKETEFEQVEQKQYKAPAEDKEAKWNSFFEGPMFPGSIQVGSNNVGCGSLVAADLMYIASEDDLGEGLSKHGLALGLDTLCVATSTLALTKTLSTANNLKGIGYGTTEIAGMGIKQAQAVTALKNAGMTQKAIDKIMREAGPETISAINKYNNAARVMKTFQTSGAKAISNLDKLNQAGKLGNIGTKYSNVNQILDDLVRVKKVNGAGGIVRDISTGNTDNIIGALNELDEAAGILSGGGKIDAIRQVGKGDIIEVLGNGMKRYIEVKSSSSSIDISELKTMVENANAAADVIEVCLKVKSGTINPATRKTIEAMGIIIEMG